MTREFWPCRENGKGCEVREPGCQDKCMRMLAAQLCAGERRKVEKAAKRTEADVVSVLSEDAAKRQRRKLKQR